MPGFMRSSSAACWLWLVLLYDALLHLVHAVTVEDRSEYQACLASYYDTSLSECNVLNLYNQGLTGTLPTELGMMTSMTTLEVGQNNLDSSLPTELGMMTNMREFWVYNNNLESSLPTELGLMTAMTNFRVYNNNLEGSLPTELELLTAMQTFYVFGNAGLCGPLVDVGNVGYTYGLLSNGHHTSGTNLENACPTIAPTSTPTSSPTETTSTPTATTAAPTETTSSPTATRSPTSIKPCCETLRENLIFCCMEARNPALARSVCQECGTGK